MNRVPVTVSQLNAIVRGALSQVPDLEDVLVEGEVSNLSRPASGHIYFTLKDRDTEIRCACFRGALAAIPFRPENGMTVILHARLDVYEQKGTYQLYVDRIEPSGVGALAVAVEQTKRRLAAEGLFDERAKRPLPALPRRVAVVTSPSGAAFRDVCQVIRRRAPIVDMVLVPATVQGADAVPSLLTAIARAQFVRDADLILVVRGGGSLEDLMAFNDEGVARAIRGSSLPVISGVGHETDTTIADLAADRRAPTPSAAAELAVPDTRALGVDLGRRTDRLRAAALRVVGWHRGRTDTVAARLDAQSPGRRIAGHRQDIDVRSRRLNAALIAEVDHNRRRLNAAVIGLTRLSPVVRVAAERERVAHRTVAVRRALTETITVARRRAEQARLHLDHASPSRAIAVARTRLDGQRSRLLALSPLAVLERGYSITTDVASGHVVRAHDLAPGRRLTTRFADGTADSIVAAATADGERMYDSHGGFADDR